MTMLSRRRFIAAGLAATAIPLAGRPGLAQTADGFRTITLRSGEALLRGPGAAPTPIWGYDGVVPGPTIRIRRGDEVKARVVNRLAQPTAVHWHGLRLDNRMDGVPHLTQAPIAPGGSFDYRFTAPDAGTFWYHPHWHSGEQLDRGLYGLLIVDEGRPVEVDRDVALLLDDWRLDQSGRIHESFGNMHDAAHEGRYGNHLTANGLPSIEIPVAANERVRLRLVNVANARVMPVRIAGHAATVIAIDGQPAEPFLLDRSRVVLTPGGRCDVFIDATLAPGVSADILVDTGRDEVAVARLIYAAGAPKRAARLGPIRALPSNPLPERMDFVGALKLDVPLEGGAMSAMMMGMMRGGAGMDARRLWALGGRAADAHSGPPLFSVKRGRTVMLAMKNDTRFPHGMHVHGHHFRVLDALDDGWKPWWHDTLLILAERTARIAFVADNPGKWMLHCHMIEHQDAGMAAWFEVT
jgi:FtsP/CotA-like multicopper oxidase with cupredoxin domain